MGSAILYDECDQNNNNMCVPDFNALPVPDNFVNQSNDVVYEVFNSLPQPSSVSIPAIQPNIYPDNVCVSPVIHKQNKKSTNFSNTR